MPARMTMDATPAERGIRQVKLDVCAPTVQIYLAKRPGRRAHLRHLVLHATPAHQHRVAVEQHRERLLRGLFVEVIRGPRLRITVDAVE
jgi:hypothetical protein